MASWSVGGHRSSVTHYLLVVGDTFSPHPVGPLVLRWAQTLDAPRASSVPSNLPPLYILFRLGELGYTQMIHSHRVQVVSSRQLESTFLEIPPPLIGQDKRWANTWVSWGSSLWCLFLGPRCFHSGFALLMLLSCGTNFSETFSFV